MPKSLYWLVAIVTLCGCSEDAAEADKYPAKASIKEVLEPKKIQSKPCSSYNLKFYEGDIREFNESVIRLGEARSDAKIEISDRKITILGFEGQAEEYINYSIYRGHRYTEREDANGSTLATNTETQIIVCFRKDAIAVKQVVEKIQSRGELSKSQYFNKQWLWQVEKQ